MNFSELRFWFLLLYGLAAILIVRAICKKFLPSALAVLDRWMLAALGLYLLLAVSWLTFTIFLFVLLLSYFGLLFILRFCRGSPSALILLIPLQLAPLLYYKYSWFITHEIFQLQFLHLKDLLIPVGISFYSFQLVSFAVDTLLLRKPLPLFRDFLNYVVFFPQIVAGPIERRQDLLPQMQQFRFNFNPDAINEGASWIVLGLFFKCVLADNLAQFFDRSSVDNPFLIWKANLLFGLRIYYDFAGYSLVALGIGRCFGIKLTLNFQSPYCATSITDFWRRWHISLSQWFRDYIYIPLGGNRVRWWAFNLLLVFAVSGIWHGAGWNFLIWGLLHAVLLLLHRLNPLRSAPPALGWLFTSILVLFSWLYFYELQPDLLAEKTATLCRLSSYSAANFHVFTADFFSKDSLVLLCFLGLSGSTFLLEWLSFRRQGQAYAALRKPYLLIGMVIGIVLLTPGVVNDFIYFAF